MVQAGLAVPGISSTGAAWLAKAIHPSDAVFTVDGIPTMDAVPSAALNYTSTVTVPAPGGALWNCECILSPTPIYFAKVISGDGTAYGSTTIRNTQLGTTSTWSEFGATGRTAHAEYMRVISKLIQNYRMTYASVTATLSASATQNQGSVSCAQYSPSVRNFGSMNVFSLVSAPGLAGATAAPLAVYPMGRRSFGELQNTPGGISWEAKRGVYSVLKLDGNFSKWQSIRDSIAIGTAISTDAPDAGYGDPSEVQINGNHLHNFAGAASATAVDCAVGPQSTQAYLSSESSGPDARYAADTFFANLQPSCTNISHLYFQNLDPSASIVFTVRVGFEATVPPNSTLIGQVGAPVDYDPIALANYFKISRQMLAGYPSEYNVFGALFNVAKTLLPKALPYIAKGADMLAGLGKNIPDSATPQIEATPITRQRPPERPLWQESRILPPYNPTAYPLHMKQFDAAISKTVQKMKSHRKKKNRVSNSNIYKN